MTLEIANAIVFISEQSWKQKKSFYLMKKVMQYWKIINNEFSIHTQLLSVKKRYVIEEDNWGRDN